MTRPTRIAPAAPPAAPPEALDAFIERKAEFDALLARLGQRSHDQFNTWPDEFDWRSVGDLARWTAMLRAVSAAVFGEKEEQGDLNANDQGATRSAARATAGTDPAPGRGDAEA